MSYVKIWNFKNLSLKNICCIILCMQVLFANDCLFPSGKKKKKKKKKFGSELRALFRPEILSQIGNTIHSLPKLFMTAIYFLQFLKRK